MVIVNEHSSLEKIHNLVETRNYGQALEELHKLRTDEFDAVTLGHYYRLLSAVNLSFGDYNEMWIDKAIEILKNTAANGLYADATYVKARIKIARGLYQDAIEPLIEAYAAFLRADDKQGMAKVLNRLCYVHVISGNLEEAAENSKKCIILFQKIGSDADEKASRRNLAQIHIVSGAFKKALQVLESLKLELSPSDQTYRCHFYLARAAVQALQGDTKEALATISEIDLLSTELKREKALYYEYFGWIQILDGIFDQAEKTLLTGLDLSLQIAPESSLISQIKRLLADCCLGRKQFDQAQKYAEEALAVAEKIGERVEIAACYRVFAQVAEHHRQGEAARQWFKKAIDLLSMIGSRYELALTRYLAAISGVYENGERLALLYLAKEYFEAEEIQPYIEKILTQLDTAPPPPFALKHSCHDCPVFIARHPLSRKIRELAENVARSGMTILLTGPTGSGKDQLATYIHFCSGRKGKFVTVNCAAIPDSMVESELFGHCRGAFTGADHDRIGLLEDADGGTFYLNEIADSSAAFQAKLLEVLETRNIRPLGGNSTRSINVRFIASTNHDLTESLRNGRFRTDLYHRLNEIPITLPSLAERPDDIPALVRHFLTRCNPDFYDSCNSDDVKQLCQVLTRRDWPGNVRQLKGEIDRLLLISSGDLAKMLELINDNRLSEKDLLLKTLNETGWNRRKTARILGKSEGWVRSHIMKYGLSPKAAA
ncbi:MAG: sigma 54-interacting transcriptional regulator [candidate division Zixibacteria bacterium]|nr:sigma 54-interacting transcriptional regulator [candidate division Zixibacteria bacterium]